MLKDKLNELLSKMNFPLFLLITYLSKCLIFGTNIAEALVVFVLSGLYGYKLFLENKEVKRNQEYINELNQIKNEINGLKMSLNIKKAHVEQQKKDRKFF